MPIQDAATAVALVLDGLGLSTEEMAALAKQGFVSSEVRAAETLYKLRFRVAGRQLVRSLGYDGERAREVREALHQLQRRRKLELQLRHLKRDAMKRMKQNKARLEPLLAEGEGRFHGLVLRRPRKTSGTVI